MKVYCYTEEQCSTAGCPFDNEFHYDPSVLYHGTHSHAEQSIESQGFIWEGSIYSRAEINSVLGTFQLLHWCGTELDGIPVLATFAQSDFSLGGGNVKGISFSSSSFGAIQFAKMDRAGGETLKALVLAFEDLSRYLLDREFRNQNLERQWEELRSCVQVDDLPPELNPGSTESLRFRHIRDLWKYFDQKFKYKVSALPGLPAVEPVDFTEQWLGDRLKQLSPLRVRCARIVESVKYGIVYAVRVSNDDLSRAVERDAGEFAFPSLPPDRIVAKAIIPPECKPGMEHRFKHTKVLLTRLDKTL
jgi:hypothetical protein